MNSINSILSQSDQSIEDLLTCFEIIKQNGNVAVIKFDGERSINQYTVFISFPDGKREMIRADEDNLKTALIKVLRTYIE